MLLPGMVAVGHVSETQDAIKMRRGQPIHASKLSSSEASLFSAIVHAELQHHHTSSSRGTPNKLDRRGRGSIKSEPRRMRTAASKPWRQLEIHKKRITD